tara:strand:- start:3953 stop:4123 length:171 start_codon:yes stop_codon:yes gene_type:complete
MKFTPSFAKWVFLALVAGTCSAAICLALELTSVLANAVPFGISAGLMYATRDKWQA